MNDRGVAVHDLQCQWVKNLKKKKLLIMHLKAHNKWGGIFLSTTPITEHYRTLGLLGPARHLGSVRPYEKCNVCCNVGSIETIN